MDWPRLSPGHREHITYDRPSIISSIAKMQVLPTELVYQILVVLPYRDVINCSLTNSRLHRLCQSNTWWQDKYHHDYGSPNIGRPIRSWQPLYEQRRAQIYSLVLVIDGTILTYHLGAYHTYTAAISALIYHIMDRGISLGLPSIPGYDGDRLNELNSAIRSMRDSNRLPELRNTEGPEYQQLNIYRTALMLDISRDRGRGRGYVSLNTLTQHWYRYFIHKHELLGLTGN